KQDFYLNLVDWSSSNILAVGLGTCVYLWTARTAKVTQLCDLGEGECVTSVAWTQGGGHIAVGCHSGEVQLWEAARCRKVRTMYGHSNRVGALAWGAHLLASGSRDRSVLLRDVRAPEPLVARLAAHRQEVCGLKWSPGDGQLASGGNDNRLFVWEARAAATSRGGGGWAGGGGDGRGGGGGGRTVPLARFADHMSAVKAIAWSPHQNGLLASGGGTQDRCIRFRSMLTLATLDSIDTGSQVCNLMWSKTVNEIVSTHGFSLNQIVIWRYPNMTKVATLTGHSMRVLYLAMSPNGQAIVTGAGDETLRFWNCFPSP
ncbi:unnamed protein product, partial [Phaeothamnion confervicola]